MDVMTRKQTYKNDRGDTQQGEAAFRERLESTAPCAAQSATQRPAGANALQSPCTETPRTDSSGNSYVVQNCPVDSFANPA
jgi:hypothetical protein